MLPGTVLGGEGTARPFSAPAPERPGHPRGSQSRCKARRSGGSDTGGRPSAKALDTGNAQATRTGEQMLPQDNSPAQSSPHSQPPCSVLISVHLTSQCHHGRPCSAGTQPAAQSLRARPHLYVSRWHPQPSRQMTSRRLRGASCTPTPPLAMAMNLGSLKEEGDERTAGTCCEE